MLIAGGIILQDLQPLLVGLLFLALLMTATIVAPPRLLVLRHLPHERMVESDQQTVGLALANAGRRSTPMLEIFDTVSDRIRIHRGTNRRLVQLGVKEQRTLLYDIRTPLRGLYTIGPVHLRAADPTGFGYRDTVVGDVRDVAVYPRIEEVPFIQMHSRLFKYFTGPFLTRAVGTSNHFYSMRDYIRGDPIRKINWKATARFRHLIVNEYEKETLCDVVFIVDARDVSTIGTLSCNPLEYCIKATASLTHHYLRQRYQIALVTYGARVTAVPPGTGERQNQRILTTLMSIQGEGKLPFATALETALPHLGPRTSVVFLSGLEFDSSLKDAVQRMISHGCYVTIISPIPVDFEAGLTQQLTDKRELVLLERANYLEGLRILGARVVEWKTDETVARLIERIELEGIGQ